MPYAKTDSGLQAFNTRSAQIAARLRPAFILFDGTKTNDQILSITGKLGITQSDIDYLIQQGFLKGASDSSESIRVDLDVPMQNTSRTQISHEASTTPNVAPTSPTSPTSARTPQERYRDAKPLATMITAGLGFRGFRLNMAVEGAKGYDDLLALLPKIQAAAGERACMALEWALKG
jgi:hypothetical protein